MSQTRGCWPAASKKSGRMSELQQRVQKVVVILYTLVRMAVNLYFSKLVLLRLPSGVPLIEKESQQRWRGFGPEKDFWLPWFLCSSWPKAKEASALCVEISGRHLTQESCRLTVDYQILAGCFVMPLVPALGAYIFLSRSDRLAEDSRLHVWSRRHIFFWQRCSVLTLALPLSNFTPYRTTHFWLARFSPMACKRYVPI